MELFLFRGISGSGKSALAKEYSRRYNKKVFSTDDYFMVDGVYQWDGGLLIDHHRKNIDKTEAAMRKGSLVLVDNTFAEAWELKPYVKLALKYKYKLHIIEPTWSKNLKDEEGKWNVAFLEKLQQNKDRKDANKSVPVYVLEKQRDKYDYNVTLDQILQSEIPDYVLNRWKELGVEED